jgi:hypothetical protein
MSRSGSFLYASHQAGADGGGRSAAVAAALAFAGGFAAAGGVAPAASAVAGELEYLQAPAPSVN